MSLRIKLPLFFLVALAASILGSWLMNPANTPIHGWLAPSLGEEGVRLLRYLVIGLIGAPVIFLIETIARSRQASHGA